MIRRTRRQKLERQQDHGQEQS
jgi:hypothetical protein